MNIYVCLLQRFGGASNKTPAPGTYNDPRSALDSLKKVSGIKRSPFGQTSVRFGHERYHKFTPGTYNRLQKN